MQLKLSVNLDNPDFQSFKIRLQQINGKFIAELISTCCEEEKIPDQTLTAKSR